MKQVYPIICPDGKDRLKAHWDNREEAEFDARYFTARETCSDWCWDYEKNKPIVDRCPGGVHTVKYPRDPEPELVWVTELDVTAVQHPQSD